MDVNVVEVNVGHMDVDELVDVELVVQVIEFINPEICGSCILWNDQRLVLLAR